MTGFAMQAAKSSRPASGAEHQFSHLWDMQHATNASHGFKVAVATVAVARFYEKLMRLSADEFHAQAVPEASSFDDDLREVTLRETAAKADPPDLVARLRAIWPELLKKMPGD